MQRIRAVGPVVLIATALCVGTRTVAADAAPAANTVFTSTAPTDAVVGGPSYAPAATTPSGQQPSFTVDPATSNAACTIANGTVSFVHAGSCVIDADDPGTGTTAQQAITVAPASTTTALVVVPGAATATVSASAPGSGTPTGTVVFSVGGRVLGSAALADGVARLAYSIPPNVTEAILASYQGVNDFSPSSATVVAAGPDIEPSFVAKPRITARLTSAAPRNAHGWWHTAVRVRFICDGGGSKIIGGCPPAVVLRRSGADLTVRRTIRTLAGARVSVTLSGIKLDLTRPRVVLVGIRNHATYAVSRPPVSCAASDPVSGLRSCTVTRAVRRRSGTGVTTITYTATATNWAGSSQRAVETIYARA